MLIWEWEEVGNESLHWPINISWQPGTDLWYSHIPKSAIGSVCNRSLQNYHLIYQCRNHYRASCCSCACTYWKVWPSNAKGFNCHTEMKNACEEVKMIIAGISPVFQAVQFQYKEFTNSYCRTFSELPSYLTISIDKISTEVSIGVLILYVWKLRCLTIEVCGW